MDEENELQLNISGVVLSLQLEVTKWEGGGGVSLKVGIF